jgi:hypothetical protein
MTTRCIQCSTAPLDVKAALEKMNTDIANLAAAVDTMATKLNADAGVTDTNYATGNAAARTAL